MAYIILESCNGCGACMRICPTASISGRKKEIHRIDETTCIDCGACGRVCPLGAVEDPFGEVVRRMKKSTWLKPVIDKAACMACGICMEACPTGALGLGDPSKKDPHAYPELVNESACIGCGLCVPECPVNALAMASLKEEVPA